MDKDTERKANGKRMLALSIEYFPQTILHQLENLRALGEAFPALQKQRHFIEAQRHLGEALNNVAYLTQYVNANIDQEWESEE